MATIIPITSATGVLTNGTSGDDIISRTTPNTGTVDTVNGLGGDDLIDLDKNNAGAIDGAIIDGGGGSDTITGSPQADTIFGGTGDDIIIGFTAGDKVDGGAGTDTIAIITPGTDDTNVSNATNPEITNVEIIDASGATGAVTISLANQSDSESFTVIGSNNAGDTITLNNAPNGNKVIGGTGDDNITGGTGNDYIEGGEGDDVINGGAGNDTIIGGDGADNINGGAGNDLIIGFTTGDIVNGGAGTNTLKITDPADGAAITAAGNNDIQNIKIIDASGATAGLIGANALDLAAFQTEAFTVIGSAFGDTITLNNAAGNKVNGGNGDDSITGDTGADFIEGGDGDDLITGGGGGDTINGGAGNDTIFGFKTGDKVDGGAGLDTLQINNAADAAALATVGDSSIVSIEIIDGSASLAPLDITLVDQTEGFTIIGSAQADTIKAGAGDDVIVGFVGADTVDGGGGTANSIFLAATSTDLNSATDAQIKNIQVIGASTAVAGVNINLQNQTEGFVIVGSAQADTLTGGSGNDFFFGFKGADTVDGKGGQNAIVLDANAPDLNSATDDQVKNIQVVYAATATAGVTIDLKNQTEAIIVQGSDFNDVITGTTANDKYLAGGKGSDTIDGGKGNDTIVGEDGNDVIFGGDGDDGYLDGGAGDDVIVGGLGNDALVGGAGNDRFAFSTGALFDPVTIGNDLIADLEAGDFIVLSKTTFTAFTASSGDVISGGTAIAAADFETIATGGAAAAGASSALIVYETSTGALYYNQDRATAGLGTGGQFATISGAPTLTASQILIVG
ncbi:calcium-binding protein [Synechococcus sp. C9]|uniref:beta strand repeat-containing protein n=1 Tax=Synechococcus sp. C9 TaxID=102119 RepID=UPI001FF57780|nr:calcium-binding protein [Synechococcus sp. C9]